MERNTLESTNKLLRVIVSLLLRRKHEETLSLREQVALLHDLGLKPAEIAEVIGRTSIYVNKELSGIRKRRKERSSLGKREE